MKQLFFIKDSYLFHIAYDDFFIEVHKMALYMTVMTNRKYK